jgi:pimeloyl-ACP methyl ester carboxylesterase
MVRECEPLKDIIHFSHANGFPAATYRTIFAELGDDYEIRAVERYGHDPRYPVTRDWPHLVEQLLAQIDGPAQSGGPATGHAAAPRHARRPVWLVGHSLGGYVSLLAALKKPHWVKGVVLLDSPVIAGWRSGVLSVSQWTGLDERLSPAAVTKGRRTRWASRDEAWRHFSAKPAFKRWDERMLADYIDFGIPELEAGGARELAFERQVEYLIYRTLPHTLNARLAHGVPVPVGFLGGIHSKEVRQVGMGATRRLVGEHLEWLDGGHLFPMEHPIETAHAGRRMLHQLRAAAAPQASRADAAA